MATAVAFRAIAPRFDVLSDAEHRLLSEWLDRVVDAPADNRRWPSCTPGA